ncbi:MAG: thrombospondin type 3 repeat-containing protein, partial [Myxococcota bacterium]
MTQTREQIESSPLEVEPESGERRLRPRGSRRKAEPRAGFLGTLLFLCGLVLASPSQAQNTLELATTSPSAGLEIQVELRMDFSETTVGGGVTLAFDPSALVVEGIEFDPSLGDDPDFRCPGSQEIACPLDPTFISFGSVAGLSGQKTIAVATLRFLEFAPTPISLQPASAFGGMDGSELSTQLSGVVVEGGIPVPSLSPGFASLLAVILLLVSFGLLKRGRFAPGLSGPFILLTVLLFTPPANAQETADSDGDGVLDSVDNCTLVANADQADSNDDGYGNLCDPDLDGDDYVGESDLAALKAAFFGSDPDADMDSSGSVDFLDLGRMAAYYGGPPGPRCPDCPLTTESGEFSSTPSTPISIPDDDSQAASDS